MSPSAPPRSPGAVCSGHAPWPLFDAARTRRIEAQALASSPPHALMARAGLSVARLALALAPHARRIGVLAGPGNNGGDALIAAGHLAQLGRQVWVLHLADPQRLPADAAHALSVAQQAGVTIRPAFDPSHDAELLIDGLLGLGATRAPTGAIAAAIDWANAQTLSTLAIDLPSGLDADHGCLLGSAAIRAQWTLSLLTLKPGLFTAQGRDHAGQVWADSLGQVCTQEPIAWLGCAHAPPAGAFAARRHTQHKGSFGDLVVVGGATGMAGAAQLAARAALTAGAGRVYLSLLDPQGALPASAELMQAQAFWQGSAEALKRATVVCGCGGGGAVSAVLPRLIEHAGRLVLDADALNAVAADTDLQAQLQARARHGLATVLTPHPLEAARLAGVDAKQVQADRLGTAQRLADRLGAVLLLKGSGSVVAAPGQLPWINASGNAGLATPGSGDVLAGWIGGLWSGGDSGLEAASLATCASTWLHGRAADLQPGIGAAGARLPLRAGDLIDAMAAALA